MSARNKWRTQQREYHLTKKVSPDWQAAELWSRR